MDRHKKRFGVLTTAAALTTERTAMERELIDLLYTVLRAHNSLRDRVSQLEMKLREREPIHDVAGQLTIEEVLQ